jgi:hypothetical protein
MVISHSYVSLPEGNPSKLGTWDMGPITMVKYMHHLPKLDIFPRTGWHLPMYRNYGITQGWVHWNRTTSAGKLSHILYCRTGWWGFYDFPSIGNNTHEYSQLTFISFRGLETTNQSIVAGKSPHEMEVDSCANRLCNWFNVPLPYMYTYIMLYSMSIPMISPWMSQIMIIFYTIILLYPRDIPWSCDSHIVRM